MTQSRIQIKAQHTHVLLSGNSSSQFQRMGQMESYARHLFFPSKFMTYELRLCILIITWHSKWLHLRMSSILWMMETRTHVITSQQSFLVIAICFHLCSFWEENNKKTARSHTHTSNETNHIVKVANVALLGNKISFQNCNTFAVLRRRNENDAKPILFAFVSLCWFSIMFYWLLRSICFVNFNQNKRKNNYIFVRRKTNEVEHLETDIMRFDEREKKQAAIQFEMSDMYQLLFVEKSTQCVDRN